MSAEYIKITLLEDMTTMLDYGTAGVVRYWKVRKRYDNGDLSIERGSERALLWVKDVKRGLYESEPSFYIPSGLKLKLEPGYKRKWYGRYFKASESHQ